MGTAYTLAGVAFIPLSGHLANIFGRRTILLIGLALFAIGSALCGAAQSLIMLIIGRSESLMNRNQLGLRYFLQLFRELGQEISCLSLR